MREYVIRLRKPLSRRSRARDVNDGVSVTVASASASSRDRGGSAVGDSLKTPFALSFCEKCWGMLGIIWFYCAVFSLFRFWGQKPDAGGCFWVITAVDEQFHVGGSLSWLTLLSAIQSPPPASKSRQISGRC